GHRAGSAGQGGPGAGCVAITSVSGEAAWGDGGGHSPQPEPGIRGTLTAGGTAGLVSRPAGRAQSALVVDRADEPAPPTDDPPGQRSRVKRISAAAGRDTRRTNRT